MRPLLATLSLILLHGFLAAAEPSPFRVRGTLPWHNFLSGPSAWDEEDYAKYLDHLKSLGLNYVAFHCYTGGAERYVPYVEPIIRMEYRDVVPQAGFDTSLTARWGYRPLRLSEFPFDTARLFPQHAGGADAFGAKCAVLPKSNDERYRLAQGLMKRVVEMAHERGIQVGIGFEFGIHPPEFPSVVPPSAWIRGAGIPDPYHPSSIEILRSTIDDILRAYPGIDWIWLWLHEMTMSVGRATSAGEGFRAALDRDKQHFDHLNNPDAIITGVWSLAYIQQAHDYLARRAPRVRMAISGWGGGTQLPGLLVGLDRALPTNIVFSCLNPDQGWDSQPPYLAELAKHRPVWAIPWLEGDARLWHPQPRVGLLREHVALAREQKLDGVLAIHWRTEEMRANLEAFGRFAQAPERAPTLDQFYQEDCERQFGREAAALVAETLARHDREQSWQAYSPEYYPYDPGWGRLKPLLRARLTNELAGLSRADAQAKEPKHKANLDWLMANYEFTLLLDEVSQGLEPAYRLKDRWIAGTVDAATLASELPEARKALQGAPVEKMIRTFARRVRSKGELGELSAINQKVWLTFRELEKFLKEPPSAGAGK